MKYLIISWAIFCLVSGDVTRKVVRLSSSNQIKSFSVPLAKELVYSWIDVQKGVYPRVQPITDVVSLGEDITLFIYFKEPNNAYDITIADCWAYDDETIKKGSNRINIYDIKNATDSKLWKKVKYFENAVPVTVLFTGFKAFKFPESDRVFLTCDINLCYRTCKKQN